MTEISQPKPARDNREGVASDDPPLADCQDVVKPERNEPINGKLEIADEKTLEAVVRSVVQSEEMFSGPVAHPKHVEHYEKIYPGSAGILFTQFQANAEHSRRMEERQLALQEKAMDLQARDNLEAFKRDRLGQILAALLVIVGIIASLIFGYMNQPWVSGGIVTSLLVMVVAAYVLRKLPGNHVNKSEKQPTEDDD